MKRLFFSVSKIEFRKHTQVVKIHSYFLNPDVFTEVFIQQVTDPPEPPVLVLYGSWTKLTGHQRLIAGNPPSGGLSWRAS